MFLDVVESDEKDNKQSCRPPPTSAHAHKGHPWRTSCGRRRMRTCGCSALPKRVRNIEKRPTRAPQTTLPAPLGQAAPSNRSTHGAMRHLARTDQSTQSERRDRTPPLLSRVPHVRETRSTQHLRQQRGNATASKRRSPPHSHKKGCSTLDAAVAVTRIEKSVPDTRKRPCERRWGWPWGGGAIRDFVLALPPAWCGALLVVGRRRRRAIRDFCPRVTALLVVGRLAMLR